MDANLMREITGLQRMTTDQLRRKYAEAFGDETQTRNKAWLVKRIAWRLQAKAEGGLSERARQLALAMADDADLRRTAPAGTTLPDPGGTATLHDLVVPHDHRLPPPGTLLLREYKGQTLRVLVRADGFEYAGRVFPSLSAVAKHVTGSHCNGFLFFKLTGAKS